MAVAHRQHEWNDPFSVIFTIVVVVVIVYMVTSYPWRPPAPEASSIISTAFSMLSSSTAFQCSVSSSFANRPPSHVGHSKARRRGDSIRLLVVLGRRRGRPPNLPKIKCYAIRRQARRTRRRLTGAMATKQCMAIRDVIARFVVSKNRTGSACCSKQRGAVAGRVHVLRGEGE
ncbi:uncharacterized protein B0T23DRAFT_382356 [Neurospora hispaniola]|uniref:Uncharacterized protein n=1 Tax=Neurospora hispaniola TaxID=588809 RepID=A0AAJ0MQC1_9PEZI|nr:hypothetical protein B0T23DRAFT_382356 [Neurospora hispaniola]